MYSQVLNSQTNKFMDFCCDGKVTTCVQSVISSSTVCLLLEQRDVKAAKMSFLKSGSIGKGLKWYFEREH